jgi:hypothetical protein
MASSLLEKLKQLSPRERSGALAIQRLDYQIHYTILRIVEMLKTDRPFVMAFDYFDDLITVDSLDNPNTIEFIQVKTRNTGNWTVRAISREVGRAPPSSIVSRMYDHVVKFQGENLKCFFVSNALFIVKNASGGQVRFHKFDFGQSAVHDSEIEHLNAAVEKDFKPPLIDNWEASIAVENCPMGLDDQINSTRGCLEAYLDELADGAAIRVKPLYESLFNTIHAKSGDCEWTNDNLQMLKDRSIGRGELEALFRTAVKYGKPSFLQYWGDIRSELSKSMGTLRLMELHRDAVEFHAKRVAGRADALQLSLGVRQAFKKVSIDPSLGILELVQQVSRVVETDGVQSVNHVNAACLVEICEVFNETELFGTSEIAPQLEDERG